MDMPPVNEFGQFRRGRFPSYSDEEEEQEEEEEDEEEEENGEGKDDDEGKSKGTRKTYEYWTVQDLRQHLRGHNLNSSGNKDVLIAKCQGYDKGLPQVLAGCSVATTQGSQPTAKVQVLEAKVQAPEAKIQVPPVVRELTAKVQVLEANAQELKAKVMELEAKVHELQEKIP